MNQQIKIVVAGAVAGLLIACLSRGPGSDPMPDAMAAPDGGALDGGANFDAGDPRPDGGGPDPCCRRKVVGAGVADALGRFDLDLGADFDPDDFPTVQAWQLGRTGGPAGWIPRTVEVLPSGVVHTTGAGAQDEGVQVRVVVVF